MKKLKFGLLLAIYLVLIGILSACTTYTHRRPVFASDGKFVGYETTRVRGVAAKLTAETLSSRTESSTPGGNVYTRSVGVEKGSASADAQAISALGGAASQLADKAFEIGLQAGKASVGVP